MTSPPSAFSIAGLRILVAEDNPLTRQIAASLLERAGCRVDIASDGREAVRLHGERQYDVVLMDCRMPVMDGCQAAAHIRSLETPPHRTSIIGLTASDDDDVRRACLAAGMDAVILKPLRMQRLMEALCRRFDGASTDMAPSPSDDELEAVQSVFGKDFGDIAALYRRDSPPRIGLLRNAAASGDTPTIADIAHVFCGSCASIGATRLSALCKRLELQARNGGPDDIDRLLDAIGLEYDRICARLRALGV